MNAKREIRETHQLLDRYGPALVRCDKDGRKRWTHLSERVGLLIEEHDFWSERIFLTFTDLKTMVEQFGIKPRSGEDMFEDIRLMVRDLLQLPTDVWKRRRDKR